MNRRQYIHHVLLTFSGTAVAQLVNLASYPILARQYAAEQMGTFSVFVATVAVASVFACGRFDVVIQAANHNERFAAFSVAQYFNVAVSTISLLAFSAVSRLWGQEDAALYALLIGVAVFATGYSNAATLFLTKHERYRASAASIVLRTLLTAAPQVALFVVLPNSAGLILGFCVGLVGQAAFLHGFIQRKLSWRSPTKPERVAVFRKYRSYLTVDVPSQLLAVSSLQALNYSILFLFTAREVGFYSVAYRLASLPLGVLATALSQVFFQKASKAYRDGTGFWLELRFNLLTACVLSVVIYLVLGLAAQPLVGVYLGVEWQPAAQILMYLAPMLAIRFVSMTVATMPLVVGRPKILLINNIAILSAVSGAAAIAWSANLELGAYLLVNTILVSSVAAGFVVVVTLLTYRQYRQSNPSDHVLDLDAHVDDRVPTQ